MVMDPFFFLFFFLGGGGWGRLFCLYTERKQTIAFVDTGGGRICTVESFCLFVLVV